MGFIHLLQPSTARQQLSLTEHVAFKTRAIMNTCLSKRSPKIAVPHLNMQGRVTWYANRCTRVDPLFDFRSVCVSVESQRAHLELMLSLAKRSNLARAS
eukprot:4463745-Amphidinium_carterae.1